VLYMTRSLMRLMTRRRLLLFKWLMVVLPVGTVAVGHGLMEHATGGGAHGTPPSLAATLPVTLLGLGLSYLFVELLFRVLRRLQAEAAARERDIQTMQAVLQERERLSRELHDGAAQLVAHLLLRLDTIKELVEANRQHEAEAELERLHGVADELYGDIGESITGLRADVTERGLVRALQDYVDQFEERHQIHTSLRADDAASHLAGQLSPLAALQLFRFVQEALTNVRKHAAAHEVAVTLRSDGLGQSGQSGRLQAVIADDGRGFIPDTQRTARARPLGLTSMRERIEALGGTFHVVSRPGSGTRVTATIPVPVAPVRREDGHAAFATPAG
jgi:two-component system, NarL family, sensor histidine kinase DegS